MRHRGQHPGSHSALPRAAPLLRFYGRQHLKNFRAEKMFENHKSAGRRHNTVVKTAALEPDNMRSNPGSNPGLRTSQSKSVHPSEPQIYTVVQNDTRKC